MWSKIRAWMSRQISSCERHRNIHILHRYEGYSVQEIARAYRLSYGEVHRILNL